ncbi:hypothetical protein MAR_024898, partial [Mya arenaria]
YKCYRSVTVFSINWKSSSSYPRCLHKMKLFIGHACETGQMERTKKLETNMYSYNERNGVQSLINVIEPFKNTTEMLSSDKIPTHGLILPALKKLNLVLTVSENDSQMIREVKIVMKGQLDNRTTDTDIDSM